MTDSVVFKIQNGGEKGVSYNSDSFSIWNFLDGEKAKENVKELVDYVNSPFTKLKRFGITLDSKDEGVYLMEHLQKWLDGKTSDEQSDDFLNSVENSNQHAEAMRSGK